MARIEITSRDLEIFKSFRIYPVQNFDLLKSAHFLDRTEATRKRITKLISAGYLLAKDKYLRLSAIGCEKLGIPGDATLVPEPMLAHELATSEIQNVLEKCRRMNCSETSRTNFLHCPRYGIAIKPDLLFSAKNSIYSEGYGVEVDMGTESLNRIVDKTQSYLFCGLSGVYAESAGARRESAPLFPLHVLFICHSRRRMQNMGRVIAKCAWNTSTIWLTTLHEAKADISSAIWFHPEELETSIPTSGNVLPIYTNRFEYQAEISASATSLLTA